MNPEIRKRDRAIVRMRQEGHIMNDIALELGVNYGVVRRVLDEQYMTREQERALRNKHIVRLRDEGCSVAEIAVLTKFGRGYIYEVLKYHRG